MTTALVLGGGFCGLLTATVLSKYFDVVKVIERSARHKSVPQQHHIHVLQVKGLQVIEQLIPGIQAEMLEAGAIKVRWTQDTTILLSGGTIIPRIDVGIYSLALSRHALEAVIYKQVTQLAKVEFLFRSRVDYLQQEGSKIMAVQMTNLNSHESQMLACDFIADCTGRQSKSLNWLQQLGYQKPQVTEINAFLGYESRFYRVAEGYDMGSLGIAVQPLSQVLPNLCQFRMLRIVLSIVSLFPRFMVFGRIIALFTTIKCLSFPIIMSFLAMLYAILIQCMVKA
ncbi:MAG: FAD-dependent monooxygenase [Anaerolineae bacterium]|nr:FAD-dependent monooxygenase [Anaerolineae bacterium]MDQ7035013.1 FAD-dependent monooxygenase [Anaerolineae bacterium]